MLPALSEKMSWPLSATLDHLVPDDPTGLGLARAEGSASAEAIGSSGWVSVLPVLKVLLVLKPLGVVEVLLVLKLVLKPLGVKFC